MSEKPIQRSDLKRELDALAVEASRSIRASRRRSAMAKAISLVWPLLVVIPAGWLALELVLVLPGAGSLQGMEPWLVLATVLVPGVLVLAVMLRVSMAPVDRRDSLASLDRELGLEDRLVTAEEFLSAEESSPFMEAAIADACRVVSGAHRAVLHLEHARWVPTVREKRIAIGSALLLLLCFLIGRPQPDIREDLDTSIPDTQEVASLETRENPETELSTGTPREEPPAMAVDPITPGESRSAETRRDKAGKISEEAKESEGKSGEGRSSDAESTSGASESRGTPSSQSQESKAGKKPNKKEPKKRNKPQTTPRPTEKKNAEENSGSTAGKGSSKGSNKNPAVSKWSSKDQVTTEDDQEIEDDEETEDEEEDQESRGGVQPNLRDRKPPVSRDLRIGFGNQKNPDANGRGGPSEAKKSRGTASLVLGVPIPDRVKGQPNPGKTKITQERIEPKAEETAPIGASERKARESSPGHVKERELTPWMRTLVREYFLTLRKQKRQS